MIRIKNHINGFLVVSVILLVILFSHQASAVDLCGVHISYPGASITTNNAPCITVNSISIGSSGITTAYLSTDQNRTYDIYPTSSITPIPVTWQNHTSTYSQWLVTSANPDTAMKVTGTELNNVFLNYLAAPNPDVWSYDSPNATNNINVGSGKFIQLFLNASIPTPVTPPVFAVAAYNQTALSIPWTTITRNATSFESFVDPTNNGTITSLYQGLTSTNTLTMQLGTGTTPYTLDCNPISDHVQSNGSKIYYGCNIAATKDRLDNIDITSGTNTMMFTSSNAGAGAGGITNRYVLLTEKQPTYWLFTNNGGQIAVETTATDGNVTQLVPDTQDATAYSNEKIVWNTVNKNTIKYNYNSTTPTPSTNSDACRLTYIPTNTTVKIDDIACDTSIPANVVRYWNGMAIQKVGNYYVNQTLPFFNPINASPYKLALTLSGPELGVTTPFVDLILHKNNVNYMVVVTTNKIYYTDVKNVMSQINNFNRAVQSYMTTQVFTDSSYAVPNPMISSYKIYGPNTNVTVSGYGMFTLVSGYTAKLSSIESAVRTLDPQWTNQNTTNIPSIATSGSVLFPIILTVSNAPDISALKVTNPSTVIGGLENTWSIVRLDSTHTAEFDITAGQCPNIYVADTTVYPYLYLPQGNVCATGTNIKTVAFTNLLPLTFYSLNWGVTDTFTPATNALQTMVRHTSTPYTYTVVIYNSTGAPALTQVFTGNSAVDTRNFNTTGISKPATLAVFAAGTQIYTSYLGSSLSLASVATFFHQYMSYQGFDLLSFIPIIFASAFSRNTVGIGVVLTVVCIATLSWLSIVIIPEQYFMLMIVVAILGLIGYRSFAG